jgi:hypothetical protein
MTTSQTAAVAVNLTYSPTYSEPNLGTSLRASGITSYMQLSAPHRLSHKPIFQCTVHVSTIVMCQLCGPMADQSVLWHRQRCLCCRTVCTVGKSYGCQHTFRQNWCSSGHQRPMARSVHGAAMAANAAPSGVCWQCFGRTTTTAVKPNSAKSS